MVLRQALSFTCKVLPALLYSCQGEAQRKMINSLKYTLHIIYYMNQLK